MDPTVDPPVAEEVPNEHSNAPHPTGTTNGTLSTPGTEIVALLDLSQDTDSGEVQANTEEVERTAENQPEGGGTVELIIAPVPAEVQAQDRQWTLRRCWTLRDNNQLNRIAS